MNSAKNTVRTAFAIPLIRSLTMSKAYAMDNKDHMCLGVTVFSRVLRVLRLQDLNRGRACGNKFPQASEHRTYHCRLSCRSHGFKARQNLFDGSFPLMRKIRTMRAFSAKAEFRFTKS